MYPLLLGILLQSPAAEPPKVNIEDWTPRPATGKAEPWEKMRDPQWDDDRFPKMNTGPTFNASFRYASPDGKTTMVMKGTAVRVGFGGVLFDRLNLKTLATWSNGFLFHTNKRFGLMNTPSPIGTYTSSTMLSPGWSDTNGRWNTAGAGLTNPLPKSWARYRGMHRIDGGATFEYTVGSSTVYETLRLGAGAKLEHLFTSSEAVAALRHDGVKLSPAHDPKTVTAPSAKQWGEPIVTPLVLGNESGPFAVDTLTIPYENRFNALFFCTGVDFLPDGRIAVCTAHGDVWLVKIDESAKTCSWRRYATGLYQPLGLKVVSGKVFVLERGQLTRLHDRNDDGEADFYECFNNDWHCGGGEHAYDACLETDPEGNFYFQKTGDTHLPHGGCVMKISADGSKCEVFATGTRHPIGLGVSPTGIVTGADQEGNYVPATRIDQYKKGGFYGDLRAHHRDIAPTMYDEPICWLPREVDNSAGGQVWVPEGTFGPLAGLPLHFSYGRCKAFVLLRQELADGRVQGGVWDLNLNFLSGSARGRFHPTEKSLFVVGLNGWQTAAKADGSLQRVRTTGKPLLTPIKHEVVADGVKLTFSAPLDRSVATNPANYRAAAWNYRWTKDYGSKRWKPSAPTVEGQDEVAVRGVELSADGRTVIVRAAFPIPVMQVQLGVNLRSSEGDPIAGLFTMSIHAAK